MEYINIFAADSGIQYKDIRYFYASCILAAVFCILFFVIRKSKKFKKGEKIYALAFAEGSSYLKGRKILYQILSVIMALFMVGAFLSLGLVMSRPYKEEVREEQKFSRDIVLCMDVSTSVCRVNAKLCRELKSVVSNLKGDRFAIVIFNTTPVLFCPMTDDYQYVLNCLDELSEGSEVIDEYVYKTEIYTDEVDYWIDRIYTGTNETNERGSSFAGDGLASTVFHFPKIEEERTRAVIYTSDNDINETGGTQYFTIQEAADLCKKHDILVYGIGTTFVPREEDQRRPIEICMNEMKTAVESTGGAYYLENEMDSYKSIVTDIEKLTKNAGSVERYVTETHHPELPIFLLAGCFLGMFVTLKFMRK